MIIGHPHSQFAFYLPTAPLIPDGWHYRQQDAIASLIALNGNHWRKIFTIMAKICVDEGDWRTYRDTLLLKQREMLIIGSAALIPSASVHLISGKVAAGRLGIDIDNPQSPIQNIEPQGKLIDCSMAIHTQVKLCLLTPYLDYRQYPNALIELSRQHIAHA